MENILVDKYIIERIKNTLRLCTNHFDSYSKKTCLDRDVIMCLNYARKLLNGDEITGKERIEPLINKK